MKKKRVTKAVSKKAASRDVKPRAKVISKKSTQSASASKPAKKVSKKVKPKAKAKKPLPVRSARIANVLKNVPPPEVKKLFTKVPSKPAAGKRLAAAEVEPMSQAVPMPVEMITDLPFSYGETKIVLLVRDPFWAYTYWDFSSDTWNWIIVLRERDAGAQPKLRVHNVDQGSYYDLDVYLDAKNWYVELGQPNTTFELELGILDSSGRFHRIALSNRMKTPRSVPSEHIDAAWELSDFEATELYRLSGGGRTGQGSESFSSLKRPK